MAKKEIPYCNLKKVRLSRSLTQDVLAERIGIRSASIAMLENNKRGASVETVLRLMTVLCCSFEELYPAKKVEWQPTQQLENGDLQTLIV